MTNFIQLVKDNYPMFKDVDDSEFYTPFPEYKNFVSIPDDDGSHVAEFKDGMLVRVVNGFSPMLMMQGAHLRDDPRAVHEFMMAIDEGAPNFFSVYGCAPSSAGMDRSMLSDNEKTKTGVTLHDFVIPEDSE